MTFEGEPRVFKVVQFNVDNATGDDPGRLMFGEWPVHQGEMGFYLVIPTAAGEQRVNETDWIIKDADGGLSIYKSEVFRSIYPEIAK